MFQQDRGRAKTEELAAKPYSRSKVAEREKLGILGNAASLRMVGIVPENKATMKVFDRRKSKRQEESPRLPPRACRK